MDTIPPSDAIPSELPLAARLDAIRSWAHNYIKGGWAVFMLSTDGYRKLPPKDCPNCYRQPKTTHDPEACTCLTCHAFYAATTDPSRFDQILAKVPHGHLAIRTGRASRILVVDAEAHATDLEQSGLTTLDEWEMWTGWSLPPTLEARSVNGGIHKFYRLPDDCGYIKGGRVLPNVDVKADSGYVAAVSGISSRTWVDTSVKIATAPEEMISWLQGNKRRVVRGISTGPGYKLPGYDYFTFLRTGCPDGYRNNFINELLFRERKSGAELDQMLATARIHWLKLAQPSKGNARWEMPWYEIVDMAERVHAEIEPDTIDDIKIPTKLQSYARDVQQKLDRGEVVQVGRRAIVRHPGFGK